MNRPTEAEVRGLITHIQNTDDDDIGDNLKASMLTLCEGWLRLHKAASDYDAAYRAACKDKSLAGVALINAETAALDALMKLIEPQEPPHA